MGMPLECMTCDELEKFEYCFDHLPFCYAWSIKRVVQVHDENLDQSIWLPLEHPVNAVDLHGTQNKVDHQLVQVQAAPPLHSNY